MLARRVLTRLDKAKAEAQQRQFIDDAAVADSTRNCDLGHRAGRFGAGCWPDWKNTNRAAPPATRRRWRDGRRLLAYSTESDAQQLAEKIDEHYRNANVRVVVAGDLINRLVPEMKARRKRSTIASWARPSRA